MLGRKETTAPLTAAEIAKTGRPITKADLRHKLREIGGFAGIGADDNLAEAIVEAAVITEAEELAEREQSPFKVLLAHMPRVEVAIALTFAAVIVVYRIGEISGRGRGPQIEVSPLRWDAGA